MSEEKFTLIRPKKFPVPPKDEVKLEGKRGKMQSGKVTMAGDRAIMIPPAFQSSVRVSHKYYFYVTASLTAQPISTSNFFGACGAAVSTNTTGVMPLATSIKIRHIRIWTSAASAGGQATQANVEWATALTSFDPDMEKDRVLPSGVSVTGPAMFKPPAKSLGQFWINSNSTGSNSICTISAPIGSVIELSIQWILRNNFTQYPQITVTSSSVAPGTVVYGPLDGPGGKFIPAGLPPYS